MSNHTEHITRLSQAESRGKVAVLGDLSLQISYQGTALLADASTQVRTSSYQLADAALVAQLCRALGVAEVHLYGVVGADALGRELLYQVDSAKIDRSEAIVLEQFATRALHRIGSPVTERYVLGGGEAAEGAASEAVIEALEKQQSEYDCIIVVAGAHSTLYTEAVQRALSSLSAKRTPVLISVPEDAPLLPESTAVTVIADLADEIALGRLATNHPGAWVALSVEDGVIGFDTKQRYSELGFHLIKEAAGEQVREAFLAGFAASTVAGGSFAEAVAVGNLAKGVSIQPFNYPTGVTLENLLALSESVERRYEPLLASDSRLASYIEGSEIEVIDSSYRTSRTNSYPVAAIFDLDGTLSTLREGWDTVMHETMVGYITGDQYQHLSRSELDRIAEQVARLIERTTGVQTVIQMMEMMDLLRFYGYVPAEQVATAHEYKDWYAQKIRDRVEYKFARYEAGELGVDAFTINGALDFLHHLKAQGTRLYLASGTDDSDVKHELTTFGYADLFDGGIYGSVGDTANDPKAVVVAKAKEYVLSTKGTFRTGDAVVFGDGPVEIREGRAAGFVTVGMISDEKQRWGTNPHKRERLILAGSDFLMPDYSWAHHLGRYLGWQ
ncbi:MAG TPA: HAD family hydrolase [Sphaerochaeta sp.]|nr:HAD family hydrolase [Sphaerochaeta sp.]